MPPTIRPALPTDKASFRLLWGVANADAAFQDGYKPIVAEEGVPLRVQGVTTLRVPRAGQGGLPQLGAIGLRDETRLDIFHSLIVACGNECIAAGFEYGEADNVTDVRFVAIAKRYGMEVTEVGRNLETGGPGHYRIRAHCPSIVAMKAIPA